MPHEYKRTSARSTSNRGRNWTPADTPQTNIWKGKSSSWLVIFQHEYRLPTLITNGHLLGRIVEHKSLTFLPPMQRLVDKNVQTTGIWAESARKCSDMKASLLSLKASSIVSSSARRNLPHVRVGPQQRALMTEWKTAFMCTKMKTIVTAPIWEKHVELQQKTRTRGRAWSAAQRSCLVYEMQFERVIRRRRSDAISRCATRTINVYCCPKKKN